MIITTTIADLGLRALEAYLHERAAKLGESIIDINVDTSTKSPRIHCVLLTLGDGSTEVIRTTTLLQWLEPPAVRPMTPPVVHKLKTMFAYFDAIAIGEKLFEVRENDRHFEVGHWLELRRWSSDGTDLGERLFARVSYLLSGLGLKDGYVAMSLGRAPLAPAW